MAVTAQNPAPYAPSAGVMDIISRYRKKGMQTPITAEVLGRAGVPDSLVGRTLQALIILDLVTDEGMPTPTFEGLRTSPEDEYKQRLQEWLRNSYSDVFGFVDPQEDDEVRIRDAFRTYRPMGQQSRMVSLFIGLCAAAGIRPDVSTEQMTKTTAPKRNSSSIKKASPSKAQNTSRKNLLQGGGSGLPSALEGLMKSLPQNSEGWTKEEFDKFVKTITAVLEFCYPIVEHRKPDLDNQDNN